MRELPSIAGSIDVCVVGLDGALTVVECKLAANPERRRMVIGQVLDYASAIWTSGFEEFAASWGAKGGADLASVLEASALDALKTNIREGRMNLCLAVDLIDSDLRRLVEYLNLVTRPDVTVTALQLRYARQGDVELLIPTTFGGELAAVKAREWKKGESWSRERFVEALTDEDDRRRVLRLLELLDSLTERRGPHEPLWFGSYPGGGVFFHLHGLPRAPFQLWINKAGRAMVYGNWRQYPPVAGHDGFAPVARALGLDHRGPMKAVPLAVVDVDALWAAALQTAAMVNGEGSTG